MIGYYDYHAKADNNYLIQSAALQMMADVGRHPYNDLVFGPTLAGLTAAGVPGLPADFTGYGGVGFYTDLSLGLAAGVPLAELIASACSTTKVYSAKGNAGLFSRLTQCN